MRKVPYQPKLKKADKKILTTTLALVAVGLLAISSASVVLSYQRFGYNTYYLSRQTVFVGVGLIFMFLFSRLNYHLLKKYALILVVASVILLLVVLVPGWGFQVGNAKRWINLGFFFLQPSEFAKLAMIIYLAAWFETRSKSLNSFFQGLFPPLLVILLLGALIVIEPDFGSTAALLLIAFAIFFASGCKFSHLLTLLATGFGLGWILIQAAPYRLDRIRAFLNIEVDPLGIGYQINQALLAIGSGGFWGLGWGESRQKFNFLPEPIGDSIFAVIAEELGLIRIMPILLLYALFVVFGLWIAKKAPDTFGRLLAIGITMWVIIQTIFNIGAMVGVLPLTGITLPFISYGGSSIIILLVGVGILLNISKHRV